MSHPSPNPDPAPKRVSKRQAVLMWVLAFLLMLAAASYQRRTGPTNPQRGVVELGGQELHYSQIDLGVDPAEAIETGR